MNLKLSNFPFLTFSISYIPACPAAVCSVTFDFFHIVFFLDLNQRLCRKIKKNKKMKTRNLKMINSVVESLLYSITHITHYFETIKCLFYSKHLTLILYWCIFLILGHNSCDSRVNGLLTSYLKKMYPIIKAYCEKACSSVLLNSITFQGVLKFPLCGVFGGFFYYY